MKLNKKVAVFGICTILMVIATFYAIILLKTPNYKKCDKDILLYDKKQSSNIRVSTLLERKCDYNFFLAMTLYAVYNRYPIHCDKDSTIYKEFHKLPKFY